MSIGAVTGSSERWTIGVADEHDITNTDSWRTMYDTLCLVLINTSGAVVAQADFVSFITNGIRINWSNAPGQAFLLTVILFAGLDDAYAGHFDVPDSEDGSVDVTAPGFEPDLLFGISSNIRDMNYGTVAMGAMHIGHAVNGGNQMSLGWYTEDNSYFADVAGELNDGYGYSAVVETGSSWFYIEFGGWDSSGFTATKRLSGGTPEHVCYLALKFSDSPGIYLDVIDTKGSTGTQAYTGPGFQPMFLCLGLSALTAVDTYNSSNFGGSFGIGVATATDNEYTTGIQSDDGASPSNTQSLADSIVGNQPGEAGNVLNEAELDSWDTNGFTLNFTTANATVRKWLALAIEDPATGQKIPPMMRYYRQRRM